ncbi:hypothetical protein OKA05_04005 [Luteolibacter arcticus]|uniref:Uncharacterized protein n=1 Tax=Luteolibacter arcticus TaxID=1581411 RepID=A0ABT3GDJ6_9BACT|nr:hypothetical protein [Luteolibacter arcticus]MCW1921702.1 hypothetical protein [Luteolibacter arcticus]
MKAFQHFDRALSAESRARSEKDIEAGIAEAPKVRKKGTGRPRRSSIQPDEPKAKLNSNGKVEVTFPVSPKFVAAAALTAARRRTTTQDVIDPQTFLKANTEN